MSRPRQPINHGTEGGYTTHRRRKEPPCAKCILAHRRYQHDRKRIRLASKLEQQIDTAAAPADPDALPATLRRVRCAGGIYRWESAS